MSTAIQDQCKSKKCTDAILEIINNISIDEFSDFERLNFTIGKYEYDEINKKNILYSNFTSDECKSLHATSNTTSIIINSKTSHILLIALTLSLLFI